MKKRIAPLLALTLLAAWLPGCSTNTQGDDASPVYFQVSSNDSLAVNVAGQALVQVPSIEVRAVLKNPGAGTSDFLDVRLEDYSVEWRRTDGGTTAPLTERFGGVGIVPIGGTSTLNDYPIMSAGAVQRTPLDRLFPFNGGFDPETGRAEIRTVALVTFNGHTMSGQPVTGTGTLQVYFFYAPLTQKVSAK